MHLVGVGFALDSHFLSSFGGVFMGAGSAGYFTEDMIKHYIRGLKCNQNLVHLGQEVNSLENRGSLERMLRYMFDIRWLVFI